MINLIFGCIMGIVIFAGVFGLFAGIVWLYTTSTEWKVWKERIDNLEKREKDIK